MSFSITDEQARSMDVLVVVGFGITHFYADGVVRMAKGESMSVFIKPDGTVKRQHIPQFDVDGNMLSA